MKWLVARRLLPGRAPEGEALPFWQQPGWRVSAGFIAIALATGLLAVVTQGVDGAGAGADRVELGRSQPLVKNAAGPDRRATPGRKTGCRTADLQTALPKSAPEDVQWRELVGTKVPTSTSAGPLLASGPLWWCFARTPMGAVMAAHVIPTQIGGSAWRTVADQQIVTGPRRDFFVAMRSTSSDAVSGTPSASYAGFSVSSYSADKASVKLLIKGNQGTYFWTSVSVRWEDGDWKAVPQRNGSLFQPLSATSGTGGFLLWRP
ncbi:hypothetical protein ACIOKD_41420 [Streptomyces sp. NPDC087844]|uniref:hypothetical protein n=1 Tax=Streptomyces sp. NPDC087844 TaxID=3365805 RepID=UPI0038127649